MQQPIPWQRAQWARVEQMRAQGRVPHALLLRGVEGVGKRAFARRLAALLLCEGSEPPCGHCRGCRLLAASAHPDALIIQPEEGRQTIGVDQIRALIDHVLLTTRYGGYKVVLLEPAEGMTHQAVNTLLKTLEEPPGKAVMVLVSHRSSRLPATIRSRCQTLEFPVPTEGPARQWLAAQIDSEVPVETLLKLAGGVPYRALAIAEAGTSGSGEALLGDLTELLDQRADPVAVAFSWRGQSVAEVSGWLTALTSDLIRLKSDSDCANLTHVDLRQAMQPVARRLDLQALFGLLDQCLEARWLSTRQTSVNEQLVLEDIAIRWASAGRG